MFPKRSSFSAAALIISSLSVSCNARLQISTHDQGETPLNLQGLREPDGHKSKNHHVKPRLLRRDAPERSIMELRSDGTTAVYETESGLVNVEMQMLKQKFQVLKESDQNLQMFWPISRRDSRQDATENKMEWVDVDEALGIVANSGTKRITEDALDNQSNADGDHSDAGVTGSKPISDSELNLDVAQKQLSSNSLGSIQSDSDSAADLVTGSVLTALDSDSEPDGGASSNSVNRNDSNDSVSDSESDPGAGSSNANEPGNTVTKSFGSTCIQLVTGPLSDPVTVRPGFYNMSFQEGLGICNSHQSTIFTPKTPFEHDLSRYMLLDFAENHIKIPKAQPKSKQLHGSRKFKRQSHDDDAHTDYLSALEKVNSLAHVQAWIGVIKAPYMDGYSWGRIEEPKYKGDTGVESESEENSNALFAYIKQLQL